MPTILKVAPHLSHDELVRRFKDCRNAREQLRWQAVMLKAEGWSSVNIASICKREEDWVRRTVRRYNEEGPDGLLDGRRDNGVERVLNDARCAELAAALRAPPPDGGLWSARKVAAWIKEKVGVEVHEHTGWLYMMRVGFTQPVPRPKHPDADGEAQEAFKKGGLQVLFETSFESIPERRSRSGRRTKGVSG